MGAGQSSEEAPVSLPAVVTKQEPKKPNTEGGDQIKRSNSKALTEVVSPKAKEETPKPNIIKVSKEDADKRVVKIWKEDAEKPQRVPHMYQAIIKHADSYQPTNGSLLDQIQSSGIFLNNKKQKYWVEEKTGHNCFMLFARSLQIVWSENKKYWQWSTLKINRDVEIEIASLLNVCWLEVHGRFEASYLTPKVMYEVVFVVMMEVGYGWAKPVNLRLVLPNKDAVQQHEESLLQTPKGQWIELKVGEFMADEKLAGEMEFSLFEYEGGQWKRGLVIKGAIIRPKK